MISLAKIITEDLPYGIEEPSLYKGENEWINKVVSNTEEIHPEGIMALDVFNTYPKLSTVLQLKILIALAKQNLLNFRSIPGKVKPDEVLQIYGNDSKSILDKNPPSLNESFFIKY